MNSAEPISYPLSEFIKLNHGKVKLPPCLVKVFSEYKMPPCCLSEPYLNQHNPNFNQADTTAVRSNLARRIAAHQTDDDQCILSDIRRAFSSVNNRKDGSIFCTATINQMIIPTTMIDQIAELFFKTMVQCPNLIGPYLRVLFSLKRYDNMENKIQLSFCRHVLKTFDNPVTLGDTKICDGVTLTRQHREVTCQVLANLYAYDYTDPTFNLHGPNKRFSNYDHLMSRLITPLFNLINSDNEHIDQRHLHIKCLSHVLGILQESDKFSTLIPNLQPHLQEVFKNPKFKLVQKIVLLTFISSQP